MRDFQKDKTGINWAYGLGAVAGIIAGVVAILIGAGVITLGWNLVLAPIIGTGSVNLLQMLAIIVYISIMMGLYRAFWKWALGIE